MTTETTSGPPGRPLVIAHRGASAVAPENTIAAFEQAITDGADAIDLDLHLSRDDQLVVIHDSNVGRTTNGSGSVRDRTLRELKRLDAGSWRGARVVGPAGQNPPTWAPPPCPLPTPPPPPPAGSLPARARLQQD